MHKNGLTHIPNKIAEFGPGDSIGIGLCAMLSGCNEYYALDVVKYTNLSRNLKIYDELVTMFKAKEKIPDNIEFPKIKPDLDDYSFPHHILTDEVLMNYLEDNRIERIRGLISNDPPENLSEESINEKIVYVAPWTNYEMDLPCVDFVISQAVLEHIDELDLAYAFMSKILVDGGFMSHDIDFKSHGTAREWNGHWGYSESFWKIIRGKQPYLLNRKPLSTHKNLCEKYQFKISELQKITSSQENSIKRKKLKNPFKELSEEDFSTSSAYMLSKKKG